MVSRDNKINQFFHNFGRTVIRFRWVFLSLYLLMVCYAITGLEKLQFDSSNNAWYFKNDEIAKPIMDEITCSLIDLLGLKISQQRLDSTHIFSDMASFGRTRLMGVTIKRFLKQLKRHDKDQWRSLEESLRQRYIVSESKLFADHQSTRQQLRQSVAEDLLTLVSAFSERAGRPARIKCLRSP